MLFVASSFLYQSRQEQRDPDAALVCVKIVRLDRSSLFLRLKYARKPPGFSSLSDQLLSVYHHSLWNSCSSNKGADFLTVKQTEQVVVTIQAHKPHYIT